MNVMKNPNLPKIMKLFLLLTLVLLPLSDSVRAQTAKLDKPQNSLDSTQAETERTEMVVKKVQIGNFVLQKRVEVEASELPSNLTDEDKVTVR